MRRLRPASLYPQARASVLIPLAIFGLPEEIAALGETWALKEELHVTAAHTPWLAERAGVSLDHAWDALSAALEGRRAGPVRVGDELRLGRDGEGRTVSGMGGGEGLVGVDA